MSNTYATTSTEKAPADLTKKAKDAIRDVKAQASNMTDEAVRAAKDNAAQLGDVALNLANTAKDKAEEQVTRQKSLGADYVESLAKAAHRAAGEFEEELPKAANYIRRASAQIQGFSDTVRTRDVRELVGEVQEFARKQPTLFFGGAVILGFAALRFLKSSAPSGHEPPPASGFGREG